MKVSKHFSILSINKFEYILCKLDTTYLLILIFKKRNECMYLFFLNSYYSVKTHSISTIQDASFLISSYFLRNESARFYIVCGTKIINFNKIIKQVLFEINKILWLIIQILYGKHNCLPV